MVSKTRCLESPKESSRHPFGLGFSLRVLCGVGLQVRVCQCSLVVLRVQDSAAALVIGHSVRESQKCLRWIEEGRGECL